MKTTESDAIALELRVPRQVRRGDLVRLILTVRNNGADTATVYLRGRPVAFEIRVARQGGVIVWRRLENQTANAILQLLELTPGASFELSDEWNQIAANGERIPAGVYSVEAELMTRSGGYSVRSPPVPLEIL